MNYGTTDSVLKPFNEVLLPDPRFKFWALESDQRSRPFELADMHGRLRDIKLGSAVPNQVGCQFETSKNLMLYAWFVFEFQTIAELQAYATLELALRMRFPDAKRERKRKGVMVQEPETLGPLLKMAAKEGSLLADKLPAWERFKALRVWREQRTAIQFGTLPAPSEWLQAVMDSIPNTRNDLAHGNFHLDLFRALRQMELCADLINALFSTPSVSRDDKDTK